MINFTKNITLGIFILFSLFSCSIHNKKYTNSCGIDFENEDFNFSKQDSVLLDKIYAKNLKFLDSCKANNLSCIVDPATNPAFFKGGPTKFRKIFLDHFKIPKKTTKRVVSVILTIGNNDNIKTFRILNAKKDKVYKEIGRVLSLEEMNNWKSANIVGNKCEYNIELKIYTYKK